MSVYPTLHEMFEETAERFPDKKLFESVTTTSRKNEESSIKAVDKPRFLKKLKRTLSVKNKLPWLRKKRTKIKFLQQATFRKIKEGSDKISSFLWSHGVRSGDWREDVRNVDRVAIFADPSVEFIQTLIGINRIGAIAVILNPDLEDGLKESLEETQPEITLAKEGTLNSDQRKVISDLNIPLMDFNVPDLNEKVKVNRDPYAPAIILKTSGTMGQPTLPTLSSTNLTSNVRGTLEYIPIDERDVFLSIGRFFHIFPLMSTLLVPIATGAKISYTGSAGKLDKIAQEVKPTLFFGVPKLYDMIYKEKILKNPIGKFIAEPPLPQLLTRGLQNAFGWLVGRKLLSSFGGNIRFYFSGGSSLNIKVAKFYRRSRVPLFEGYGASETSPVITAPMVRGNEKPKNLLQKLFHKVTPIPYCPDVQKVGSVGKMLPVHSYDLRSRKEGGPKVLAVKGPSVFMGNWTKDGLDRSDFDEDGFYYTKDIVEIDSEADFFFKGREDRMVPLGSGKNVHPEQLEKKLSHIEVIKHLMIDEVREEGEFKSIQALIFPDQDYIEEELQISPKDIKAVKEFIRSRIKEETKGLPSYLRLQKKGQIEISQEQAKTTETGDVKVHKYQNQN